MELKSIEEMVAYAEKKFSGTEYTAKAVPSLTVWKNRAEEIVDHRILTLEFTDKQGNRRPEFDGPIRCYPNGVTASYS